MAGPRRAIAAEKASVKDNTTGPAVLEVDNLHKGYDGVCAVAGPSFAVLRGEVLGLVGANGAGKTTTLRCLAGILPPSGGAIRIAGHDLARAPVDAKRELAFLP